MRVTTIFLSLFLLIKRNYLKFDLHNFLFDTDQNATFSLFTYLILMQFSSIEVGNFRDDFIL